MLLSKLEQKRQLVKVLAPCQQGCLQTHSLNDCFELYETEAILWQSEEMLKLDEIDLFEIPLSSVTCIYKWSILCKYVQSKKKKNIVIGLNIDQIDCFNFELSELFNSNVIGVMINGFIEQVTQNKLIALIESSKDIIFFTFHSKYIIEEGDVPLLSFKEGLLVNLKELIISSLFQIAIQEFQRAFVHKNLPHGNLQSFYLSLEGHLLRQEDDLSIANIIYFNRNTLTKFHLKLNEEIDEFNFDMIGRSLSSLTKLQSIRITIFNKIKERNQIKILNLMQGIKNAKLQESSEIYLQFYFPYPLVAQSKIGETLALFSKVTLLSELSSPSATEIGIALGKSKILKQLSIESWEKNVHLLLSYAVPFATNLEVLKITSSIRKVEEIMSICRHARKLQKLLVFEFTFQIPFNDLFQIINEISNNLTLRKLKFTIEQAYLSNGEPYGEYDSEYDGEQLASLFYKMNSLQQLDLSCIPQKKLKNYCDYLKFLKNMITHTNVLNLENEKDSDTLKKLKLNYEKSMVSQLFFIIAFMKEISIYLLYAPIRHIIDLCL